MRYFKLDRRVVRPAYAYYRGSYPVVRHRWKARPFLCITRELSAHHHPPENASESTEADRLRCRTIMQGVGKVGTAGRTERNLSRIL
jgi:hypothetical protein